VIASETAGITADLYQQLIKMLESGKLIREYTQVYESKTHRIPVIYMRDFYRFFRLVVIITINYIYQLFGFRNSSSIFGLCCCLFLMPLSYLEMGSTIKEIILYARARR
jgi:hypothetical protein